MKCHDCDGSLMPRPAVRLRGINLASSIASEEQHSPQQRAAFACFGLLLVSELGVRCEGCATKRVMAGVAMVAAGDVVPH